MARIFTRCKIALFSNRKAEPDLPHREKCCATFRQRLGFSVCGRRGSGGAVVLLHTRKNSCS